MCLDKKFSEFLKKNQPNQNQIIITSFYKFVKLEKLDKIKDFLISNILDLDITGTIILAPEGINLTIACKENDLLCFNKIISKLKKINSINPKFSFSKSNPFLRMKVKIKNEIVTFGKNEVNPEEKVGEYIDPKNWNKFLSQNDTIIIDTRNDYEISIGTFENSINPKIKNFREFPKWVDKNLMIPDVPKNIKIGMFCTGGIRCEKSTSYLKNLGFTNVYHLQGGILNYIEKTDNKQSMWNGDCFVFDYRVSVDNNLKPGNFEMCFACRMPIKKEDKKSKYYSEGISCHHCYNKISSKQKNRFEERQKQIKFAKLNKRKHIGPKLY